MGLIRGFKVIDSAPASKAIGSAASRTFTIVHLSDLHLTAKPNDRRTEPRLNGRLAGMNAACMYVLNTPTVKSADLVLITGDVTDKGEPDAWAALKDMLVRADLIARTLIIPGNHDVCGLRARVGWPPLLAATDLERARMGLALLDQPHDFPWIKIVEPRVAIIGLDSNNSGNLASVTNAVGRLGMDQLSRLADTLTQCKQIPVKLIALHHSPNIPRRATALKRGQAPMSLINRWAHEIPEPERRRLRELCVTHKVRMIVHGHLHHAEDRRVNGIRIVGAPSSTEPVSRGRGASGYRVYKYSVLKRGGRVLRELITV
jgi:calcineurin-like phosphoesterase family protein